MSGGPGGDDLDAALTRLAVPGPDAVGVVEYAMGAIGARTRRNRFLGSGAAALLLLGGVGFLVGSGSEDPDEVVATATSTTTEPESTEVAADTTVTSTTAVVTTLPVTTAAPITLPAVTTTTPPATAPSTRPPTTAPPTTVPVDQTPTGVLAVSRGAAGDALDVRFEWNDPDGPGRPANIVVSTDEPGLKAPAAPVSPGGACSGGPGSSASLRDTVQFASTGTRIVTVSIAHCDGPPQVFSSAVEVSPPSFGGAPGRAVMAEIPDLVGSDPRWLLVDSGGQQVALQPPQPEFSHELRSDGAFSLRGVVVVVPAGRTGTLVHRPDGDGGATWSGALPAASQGGPATRVRMTLDG